MRSLMLACVFLSITCIASGQSISSWAKPYAILVEEDPWLMVLGSDTPRVMLYEDGTIIFKSQTEQGSFTLMAAKYSAEEFEQIKSALGPTQEFMALKERYNIAPNMTDYPTVNVLFVSANARKLVSVYGLVPDDMGVRATTSMDRKDKADDLPKEFERVYKYLVSLRPANAKEYVPEYYEVMIWPYEYSPEKPISWPASWPGTKDKLSLARGESFSIFLPSKFLPELKKLVQNRGEKQAFLIDGKKWALAYVPVLPRGPAYHHIWKVLQDGKSAP